MSKGIKEAERIAKEIGGHIPERVNDLTWNKSSEEPLNKKPVKCNIEQGEIYITVNSQDFIDLIRDAGYYQGRADELEKQLEELKRPEEVIALDPIKEYEQTIINQLNNEIKRLNDIKSKDYNIKDYEIGDLALEKAHKRIDGKIEGIEYAIDLIEKV